MVRDHSNDLNLLRVSPDDTQKDLIGRDEDGPSEVRPKVRPKDVIGRDKDGPSSSSPIKSFGASSEKTSRDSSHSNGHKPHE